MTTNAMTIIILIRNDHLHENDNFQENDDDHHYHFVSNKESATWVRPRAPFSSFSCCYCCCCLYHLPWHAFQQMLLLLLILLLLLLISFATTHLPDAAAAAAYIINIATTHQMILLLMLLVFSHFQILPHQITQNQTKPHDLDKYLWSMPVFIFSTLGHGFWHDKSLPFSSR